MPTAKLVMLETAWSASPQDSRPATPRLAGAAAAGATAAGAGVVVFSSSVVIGVRP